MRLGGESTVDEIRLKECSGPITQRTNMGGALAGTITAVENDVVIRRKGEEASSQRPVLIAKNKDQTITFRISFKPSEKFGRAQEVYSLNAFSLLLVIAATML